VTSMLAVPYCIKKGLCYGKKQQIQAFMFKIIFYYFTKY